MGVVGGGFREAGRGKEDLRFIAMMLREGIDVCVGGLLESEASVFEGADDLTAGFGWDQDIVREVGCDEEN